MGMNSAHDGRTSTAAPAATPLPIAISPDRRPAIAPPPSGSRPAGQSTATPRSAASINGSKAASESTRADITR